jgi:hypothetical protein
VGFCGFRAKLDGFLWSSCGFLMVSCGDLCGVFVVVGFVPLFENISVDFFE